MKDDLKNIGLAVLAGGMAAGLLDIVSAIGGRPDPLNILQYIGSGLIGDIAFKGGWWTGAAGLAVHFGLTLIMATLFVLAARRWSVLLKQTWLMGMVYGAVIYFAMFYFIVPLLSAATNWKTPQGFLANLKGAMLHGLMVGLPIAAAARHYLERREAR